MIPPRKHIALAIDGGGIKGLMVAQALITLEKEMGGQPLINDPRIHILSGTSTGAQIAAGIAIGLTAAEITDLYINFAQNVFPDIFPDWLPTNIRMWLQNIIGLFSPSLYSNANQKALFRQMVGDKTGNPDLTLGQLNEKLRKDQVLIITAVDLNERRTHFLKSDDPKDADWPLWQAVMASAAAPSTLPVITRNGRYYTDGGAGSFGNPAYIVAREAIVWSNYDPKDVTVFSFGTGWVNDVNFEKAHHPPDQWHILDWAINAPFLITADAMRNQSVDIIEQYGGLESVDTPMASTLDFRRFQIELQDDIALDDTRNATLALLKQIGGDLGIRIEKDQHALGVDPNFDPEGIRVALTRSAESIKRARLRRQP